MPTTIRITARQLFSLAQLLIIMLFTPFLWSFDVLNPVSKLILLTFIAAYGVYLFKRTASKADQHTYQPSRAERIKPVENGKRPYKKIRRDRRPDSIADIYSREVHRFKRKI